MVVGKVVSSYWDLKGNLFWEYARLAHADPEEWSLYADARALDEAFDICRYAKERSDFDNRIYGRANNTSARSFFKKRDCYRVFFEMAAVYLEIEKEA